MLIVEGVFMSGVVRLGVGNYPKREPPECYHWAYGGCSTSLAIPRIMHTYPDFTPARALRKAYSGRDFSGIVELGLDMADGRLSECTRCSNLKDLPGSDPAA
ncbi:uncharacterized protein H6S33_011074 [Morchella sextelata]|uniref:uncharacterized protein n=1 Tax=Morchella sextelata TaxID=1174677 RepID=UPI001D055CB1|nr:uncharacterized protein H6S33_011074 [Morchella sextelata]KAH0611809.1 hypothetical protein H6S33_011074 [Morchella sextelata]